MYRKSFFSFRLQLRLMWRIVAFMRDGSGEIPDQVGDDDVECWKMII